MPSAPPTAPGRQGARGPILTCLILAGLAVIFMLELILGIGPTSGLLAPSLRTLVALGGLHKTLVLESGEWHRLFTAMLLHADIAHLLLNGIALYVAGSILERLLGRAWLLALFVIGGLGGSLMSLALLRPTTVSVGASGAIMGLFSAILVTSLRLPSSGVRKGLLSIAARVLIPSFIPTATASGGSVDIGAHLGGALAGGAMGLVLLAIWPKRAARPNFGGVAMTVAASGAIACVACFVPVMSEYRVHALRHRLIPASMLPTTDEAGRTAALGLVLAYPHDPRARWYRASALLERGDLAAAERELRAAIGEDEMLGLFFQPEFRARLEAMLALTLNDLDKKTEAKATAKPACAALAGPLRDALNSNRLCE